MLLQVMWLALAVAQTVRFFPCVNVSRFNTATQEFEVWCVPQLDAFDADSNSFADEGVKGYTKAGGFFPMTIGQHVGRHVVQGRLGHGAFATVWKTQEGLALKLTRAEYKHMARDESDVLTLMGPHPHVVPLVESFDVDSPLGSHLATVMGMLGGRNLELSTFTGVAEARVVARDIVEALVHVHGHGIIHTDL
jgi:hypothetical protein